MVYNGKPTREWLSREESASPTVSLESIFLTSIIDANEERDVMTTNIPNAFIHAHMPDVKDGKARVIMKITGVLVDLLVKLAPKIHGPHVVHEKVAKCSMCKSLEPCAACSSQHCFGTRNSELIWKALDLNSTPTIPALPTEWLKASSTQLVSTWTI